MSAAQEYLRSLIAPGTVPEVTEHYLSLKKRCDPGRFGSLITDVVALDTETTGLSFSDCSLIEISAVRQAPPEPAASELHESEQAAVGTRSTPEPGHSVKAEVFDSFVNPGCPIPPEITRLTGISNREVIDAPKAAQVVRELAAFTRGKTIIAHNAVFDRSFIERVKGGKKVSDTWIDTLALSRIALPCLRSHRLQDLARAFCLSSATHRSADDARALFELWPLLLQALLDLPKGLLAMFADLHRDVPWKLRPLFLQLAALQEATVESFSLKRARERLLADTGETARKDADKLKEIYPLDHLLVEDAFSETGIVGEMYESFEQRAEQKTMALEVADAFSCSVHKSIEAGCGVGKSVAYLLPGVLFAQKNGVSIGVATGTNTLTDQLLTTELPALSRAMKKTGYGALRYVALKGYEHYLCLHRLERSCRESIQLATAPAQTKRSANTVSQDRLSALAIAYAFASQSRDGDADGLGIRRGSVPASLISTTPVECLRNKCPFYPNACMIHGVRRRAETADVVVTNHALLLRNIALEGRLLPPIRHWVVDEAHSFSDEARSQWSREVSNNAIKALLDSLGDKKTGLIRRLGASALADISQNKTQDGSQEVAANLALAPGELKEAYYSLDRLFEELLIAGSNVRGAGYYDSTKIRLAPELAQDRSWYRVYEAAEAAWEDLEALLGSLGYLAQCLSEMLDNTERPTRKERSLLSDLTETLGSLGTAKDNLELILCSENPDYVRSLEISSVYKGKTTLTLRAEKIDVGADLARLWLDRCHSVIFTSATLAVGRDFSFFKAGVGADRLEETTTTEVLIPSGFDLRHQMAVVVVRGLPDPGSRDYLSALEELLFSVHTAMEGSVLTLFTNRRDMEQTYSTLQPRLFAEGLDLAYQERNFSPRQLTRRFLEENSLSLLALKSFWEGFDAVGDTLRCVVVPKLPFASPTDPLSRERELRERRAWWKYNLPQAILETKQAAGRLIRSARDSGIFILADPRILTKGYGKMVISSLPSDNVVMLESDQISRFIEIWRASRT